MGEMEGDSGEDSGEDEDATLETQTPVAMMVGKERWHRAQTPMTINKWAKPLPKLELRPRVHFQCCIGYVDIAVTYWHQVYHQSEESYQDWRRSSMTERFAYEKRYLYGRKAPVSLGSVGQRATSTCLSVALFLF